MCVNDGTAAECVDPKANTICSGNFSAAAGLPGSASRTSGPGASETGNAQESGSRPASHLLSTPAIIAICASAAGVLIIVGAIRQWIRHKAPRPVPVQPVQEVSTLQIREYHIQERTSYYA
ncbi:hypothetical protein B0H19DRAFT_1111182 [Mycena capillaripes]|nr:hypothetical protein B0H19DRAFT_1111182 [Mycena capillaripes]